MERDQRIDGLSCGGEQDTDDKKRSWMLPHWHFYLTIPFHKTPSLIPHRSIRTVLDNKVWYASGRSLRSVSNFLSVHPHMRPAYEALFTEADTFL